MTGLTLALRTLRREWRGGDLRVLSAALVIAVAALVSVAAFGDRLHRALTSQGAELLAADLVVSSPYPPPAAWREEARRRGLASALTIHFRSVVVAGELTQLAEIKAVESGYPLRGGLRVADALDAPDHPANGVPAAGTVWVDAQLLNQLGLRVGAPVGVGESTLQVSALLTFEPDRGGAMFAIAPRLMMNAADLDATRLVQPGSLVQYRWLVAGPPPRIERLRQWLTAQGVSANDMRDVSSAQPRFRTALDRGERFLGLATLVSVLLAGVAIARAARHYAERQLDHAAILRCFGATQRDVVRIYAWQLLVLGALASALGCIVGYVGQQAFVALLPGIVTGGLPWPSLWPAAAGVIAGIAALLGFGLPAVMRLKDVPPLRVIRRDLGALPPRILSLYAAAFAILGGLTLWMARDAVLAAYVFGGGVLTMAVLGLAALGLLRAMSRLRGRAGASWRFGVANLVRRRGTSAGQIVALGVGAMAILLLTLVRGELLAAWRTSLPADTPNHFLINIQPDQRADLAAYFDQMGWPTPRLYPIVRARLVAINDRAVDPDAFSGQFAKRMVQRAANLSWTQTLTDDNRVVAGRWWRADESAAPLISVEQEYARALGLRLGDALRYRIAERELTVTVASLRSVAWDSFRPNFFLLVPPALLADYSASFITSVHVAREHNQRLRGLIQRFPNVTDIDVDAVLSQVRRLIDRVNAALQYVFVFALAAGFTVLYAAIYTSRDERRQEIAVLRALGADRRQIVAGLVAEFAVLGLLAGGVGAVAADVTGFALARFVLDIPYHFNPQVWLTGVIAGTLAVAAVGVVVTRRLRTAPPWLALRESH